MSKKTKTKDREELLKISKLVELSGVRNSTIKFYREQGLLPFQPTETRPMSGYPAEASIKRLEEIEKLKEKRLTIEEIKKALKTHKQTSPPKG